MSQKESPLEAKLRETQQQVDAGKSLATITAEAKDVAVAKREEREITALAGVETLDWKKLPPPVMVEILIRKPFKGKAGEPDYYLTRPQAYAFAIEAYRVDLSPLSDEVFFDPRGWRMNITTSGQRAIASRRGNVGVEKHEELKRPWPAHKPRIAPFTEDMGDKCSLDVFLPDGTKDTVTYTAWLSEWYKATGPWKEITNDMLRTRSYKKCLMSLTGVGLSEMPDDREIESEARQLAAAREVPQIDVVTADVKPE